MSSKILALAALAASVMAEPNLAIQMEMPEQIVTDDDTVIGQTDDFEAPDLEEFPLLDNQYNNDEDGYDFYQGDDVPVEDQEYDIPEDAEDIDEESLMSLFPQMPGIQMMDMPEAPEMPEDLTLPEDMEEPVYADEETYDDDEDESYVEEADDIDEYSGEEDEYFGEEDEYYSSEYAEEENMEEPMNMMIVEIEYDQEAPETGLMGIFDMINQLTSFLPSFGQQGENPTEPGFGATPTFGHMGENPMADGFVGDYANVVQTVCLNKDCTLACKNTSLPTAQCIQGGGGVYFKMSCSSDGSGFTQDQFSDSGCVTKTRSEPGKCGQCYAAGALQHVEFTCSN